MAGNVSKKRKVEDGIKGKTGRPTKKFKKQTYYESSSDEEESAATQDFQAVNLQDSDEEEEGPNDAITGTLSDEDDEPDLNAADNELEEEVTDASNSDSENSDDDSDTNSNPNLIKARKRNDPEAFATSMSKILGSKLSASKRNDPVLSRSQTAIEASKEMTDLALEKKAKHKMREEKKAAMEKGRVKDVLGASTAFDASNGYGNGENVPSVQATMELEKRLRKTAQRGVVKLFNAVRAAQVKGEEAAKEARQKGVVGQGRREEKINEMSKKGFLDLIAGGGGLRKGEIEEA
ncbi:uncharacterized protein EAF02_006009 [Botrytis sinoallii]|uniref:uncharacterized protein n=1 Tax=Botrytis sinoallii TaxID=1463999 RepID=UPI00190151A1|nr:uncharacterized protein EAF02_006009 [Botrytis sinoallii]KAF7882646.1 hypothetical protein EAF02_006009 [Botrytis sinoallii]